MPDLDDIKLKAFADKVQIDIRFGAQFTTRKLYRDCFRLNVGWELSDMYDQDCTIEKALLKLAAGVHGSLK